jgi:two-component system, cell cycle sensor histidine kinase and response regulator CckA
MNGGDPHTGPLAELLPAAIANSRLGIIVSTWDDALGAYRILYVNPALTEMWGASAEEIMRTDPFSRIEAKDDVSAFAAEHRRREATHPAIEFGVRRPDGTRIRVGSFTSQIDWKGTRHVVTFMYDVTPLEDARRAEHASETRFRALTEASPDGIALIQAGQVAYANRAFTELVFPDGASTALPPVLAQDVDGEEPRQVQLPNAVWVEVRTIRVALPGEDDTRLLVVRDLTEQLEIQEKLIHTDRLAAVGTLAAGIAHEINNPLAYVIANLELSLDQLLEEPTPRVETLTPRLQAAMQGAQRVRRIVRDLRTYSRESSIGEALTVSVESAIASAVSMAGSEISRCANLERDVAADLHVAGMPSQVEQVFLNLVLNAAQAFPSAAPDNRIRIRARDVGERISIEIEDNGPGIPDPIRSRIFDPFFTTKPVGQGTGLGLSISRNLVRLLHGQLELTSWAPGRTVFEVTLPKATAPASGDRSGRRRVLVIDDEEEVLHLLEEALSDDDVRTARDVESALELLHKAGPFDAVLCDVIMGDVRGPEMRRRALEIDRALASRWAYMTGAYASLSASERSDVRVLEKPFELRTVRELVRAMAATPRP